MASDLSFAEYVRDQISGAGSITFRKMFGEYAFYCDGKVVAFVCDNQVFVKPTAAARAMMGAITEGHPYPGSKPYFLIGDELDDRQYITNVIRLTADDLPPPRPKKPKAAAKAAKARKQGGPSHSPK